jgi:transposase-like protein
MGPYAPTRNGCRFIFVAIDGMSKYVEAMPVSKQDADTMSRFFMYEVIARHGTPSQVITDGGKEFQFSFKDLMKELNISTISQQHTTRRATDKQKPLSRQSYMGSRRQLVTTHTAGMTSCLLFYWD